MRRGNVFVGLLVALVIAGSLFTAPAPSEAVTITSVDVLVGGVEYCSFACAVGAKIIWNLGTGLVLNSPLDTAVLTQNQPGVAGQPNFNFDSSEGVVNPGGPNTSCGTPGACNTVIKIGTNGGVPVVVFTNPNSVLANFNKDPGGTSHNETSDWGAVIPLGGFNLFLGYADNAHTGNCATDTGPDTGAPCVPASTANPIWDGTGGSTAATFFLGSAVGTSPGCDRGTVPCFDAGALLFQGVRVPEPSALLLLGTGLVGLAAWGRGRNKSKNELS